MRHRALLRASTAAALAALIAAACSDAPVTPEGPTSSVPDGPAPSAAPTTDLDPVALPSLHASLEPCGEPTEVDLVAGRDRVVGAVTVVNDGDSLRVTLATAGGWTIEAAHLAAATSLEGIPTNPRGSPVPGRFPWKVERGGAAEVVVTVALADLGAAAGDEVVVAVHADVSSQGGGSEGAWAAGTRFVERGSWATWFAHEVRDCGPELVTNTITAGALHSCALDADGEAWCWGGNADSQLGDGTTGGSSTPVAVQMPPGVTFTDLAAGAFFSVALGTDGVAYAWGDNGSGQLGDGTTASRTAPVPVSMPSGVTFTAVAAGGSHALAVASTGGGWAWGANATGQLGDGSTTASATPVAVEMPSGVRFTDVAAGSGHSLALDASGGAWAWGDNGAGQLGDGSTASSATPVAVSGPPGVRFDAVAAGASHSLALGSGGTGWAWGHNGFGQLGDGTTGGSSTPVAVPTPPGVSFTTLAGGALHSLAVDGTGAAWAWGANFTGQLGDGSTTSSSVPVAVSLPAGIAVRALAGGSQHSLAIDDAGRAWGWGSNAGGQLGDGSTTSSTTPVVVAAPSGVSF